MLAHKTSHRNGTQSGVYLFLLISLALIVAILAMSHLSFGSSQASAGSDGFSNYHNDAFRYSVSYPSKWQVVPSVPDSNVTTIASSISSPETAGGRYSEKSLKNPVVVGPNNFSKIDIVAYELEEPMSAVEFLSTRSKGAIDGRIVPTNVAGQNALLVEVHTAEALAQREENLLYKSIFVTKGNYGYIIAGFADTETFNHILSSFQLD